MNPPVEPQLEPEPLNFPTKIFIISGGILLAGILLFFLFGLKPSPPKLPEPVTYNYFTFDQVGGLWKTNINVNSKLYEGIFRYNPEQVKDVYITGNFSGFKTRPLYITFDPQAQRDQYKYLALASSELSLHLIRALNYTISAACTSNTTDACQNRPIITCAINESVIYLKPEPPTQITLAGNCVTVSGEGLELLKSVDRILFQWYRIMK